MAGAASHTSILAGVLDRLAHVLGPSNGFIPLHVPEFNGAEKELVTKCIDTGWVSSVGSFVDQFERADAGAIVVVERQPAAQRPFLPAGVARGVSEESSVGDEDQAGSEAQSIVEVYLDPGLGLFTSGQFCLNLGSPVAWEGRLVAG